MPEVKIVAELVQVRMRRAVSGYGRRGALVEVGIDTAAGLMENGLAEYLGVTSFVGETEVPDGAEQSPAEPRRRARDGARSRKARGGRGDQADAEQGEGTDAR